jgi:hypothetical protein
LISLILYSTSPSPISDDIVPILAGIMIYAVIGIVIGATVKTIRGDKIKKEERLPKSSGSPNINDLGAFACDCTGCFI